MKCEFCAEHRQAKWWGWTVFLCCAWLCDEHKEKYVSHDALGDAVAITADERLAVVHKQGGAA